MVDSAPASPLRRFLVPVVIFLITATTYALVTGPRALAPSPNNHFVHLAQSWLEGELGVLGGRPPGYNDWACYDEAEHDVCAPDAFQRPREDYRWYVSFPPLPALVLVPFVALFGQDFSDPLVWAIFAGLAPAFLFLLLSDLRERGLSTRSRKEDLILVTLFAFGSVYFSTAVQGSVWFSAHVVASLLLVLFLQFTIGMRQPFWAGLMLGLCFMTRPSTSPFGLFFLLEAVRVELEAHEGDPNASLVAKLRTVRWPRVIQRCAAFGAPILGIGLLAMWMNNARFHDPFEFGHQFLMIRWRPRIEKWGLFNYHYLSKNLAVFCASLPWFSAALPYVTISRHGLALWVTSPNLLAVLWPTRVTALMRNLFIAVAAVAVLDLCYQNSGWVQFGYRFVLDYLPMLMVLMALGGRRLTSKWFIGALIVAVIVNTFGAITFDRVPMFYDDDASQERVFQPD